MNSQNKSLQRIALVPVASFALLFLFMVFLDFDDVNTFNSPLLLLVLNTVFLTGTGLAVALISARTYCAEGSVSLLLLGMATTAGGVAALLAGWAASLSVNYNVSIFDLGLLTAGGLQFLSAIMMLTVAHPSPPASRKAWLTVGYAAIVVFIIAISISVVSGLAPIFFDASGSTLTRMWTLAIGTCFFVISSLIFGWQYFKSKSRLVYWYALALALLAITLFGSAVYATPNGILNWAARLSQYLGGIYFLAAVLASRSQLESRGTTYSERWAEAFKSDGQQLDILFGKMLDGLAFHKIVCDENGKPIDYVFLDVNEAFEKMTGLSKDKIIGKRVTKVIPGTEKDPVGWITVYGKVALTGEPIRFESYSERLKKWFYVSAYSPKKSYFITLYDDITERKDLQNKLENYTKNLEAIIEQRTKALQDAERLAAIGATASMVGHDIRNPMQAITGDVYLLTEELKKMPTNESKQSMQESLDEIGQNIAYMDKIVSDLQDYTRPLRPNIEEVNLEDLFYSILSTVSTPDNIEVEVNVNGNIVLRVDRAYMRRALTNLITNAMQAMPNGGKLSINAYTLKDKALISVNDTGVGIPQNIKDKLFVPLFTTKAKGQGLGLAVVKRLIEGLHGEISFESEEGEGTNFIICLPIETDKR